MIQCAISNRCLAISNQSIGYLLHIIVKRVQTSSFQPEVFQASLVVMAKAVEVRKAAGGMHSVVMQVCRFDQS